MFDSLEEIVISFTETLSLPLFVFVASFIEEVIAPIPSPTVMVVAGSVAKMQEYSLIGLIPLAIIGALGKTIGALVVYFVVRIAGDFFLTRFGKFFNVTKEQVERFGDKLEKGYRDYFLLTFLRAIPIIPSVILSVGAGFLKISLPLFIFSTFVGTIIRDGMYLYAGYVGTSTVRSFIENTHHIESYIVLIAILVLIGIGIGLLYKKRSSY